MSPTDTAAQPLVDRVISYGISGQGVRGRRHDLDRKDETVSKNEQNGVAADSGDGERQPPHRVNQRTSQAVGSLGLTQNQFDLLRLYAHGFSVKEIAERQSRGKSTIYQSLQRIKARLNIERDADLIAFAIEHGLRSLPLPPSDSKGATS